MADFNVGSAWIGLQPSAKGFSREAKQKLAALDLSASVDLEADAAKLDKAIKEAKAELSALRREKVNPSIDLDIAAAKARADELRATLRDLSGQTATPSVVARTAEAQRELSLVDNHLAELNERKATMDVDADITRAEANLDKLEAKGREIDAMRLQPQVTADTTQAQTRLNELNGLLDRLSAKSVTPQVELQIAQARQQAERIRVELDRLATMRPTPQVEADIAAASAKLAVVNRQLSSLDGRRANAHVDVGGGSQAALILGAVVAALGAIAAAGPAAAAALAAVGGAAGALGQGAGAAMLGFAGIGDAIKAVESDEKSAASTATSSASKRSTAAKQVESAQRALGQAQITADRAAITGAQQVATAQRALGQARAQQAQTAISGAEQVADAERALASAVQNAARQRITSDQQVAAARRAVSDAVASSNQRIASAERSVENAARARQYAQESLTEAIKDATRANRDLQMSVAGAALSEKRAALSVLQARQRLANADTSDPLELADLALSVQEAEQNLAEVHARYGDLKTDQAEWARTGVAGSKQVVNAQRAVADSQQGVADAAAGLAEAQVSGARAVADAQQNLAQTQQQAAWQAADAQAGVADAQRAVGRAATQAAQANADAAAQVADAQRGVAEAVQQASWSQQDAARAVADAQRALADAYTGTGDSASAGANKAADALAKLSPAGREFVRFMTDEWQPAWERSSHSIAEALLPRVQTAMGNLLTLQPMFTRGLTESGRVIGDLAVKGTQLASSTPFQANFASIMASNNRALGSYGDAGIHVFGAFTDLYSAAGPLIEEFARLADGSAQAFESWVIGARASGDLDRWLRQAADTLQYLGGWLVDVGTNVVQTTAAFAPLGAALLEMVRGATDFITAVATFSPTLTSIAGGLGIAAIAASKMGTAMKGLAIAQGASGIGGFANVLKNTLNPAALYGSTVLTKLRSGFDTAGVGAGLAADKFTGSAKAGETTSKVMGGVGRAVSGVAAGLPLLGAAITGAVLAHDALTDSATESAEAVMKGGIAAREARDAAAEQTRVIEEENAGLPDFFRNLDEWAAKVGLTSASTKSLNEEIEKQRSHMTNLQRAQSIATEAQGNYDLALRESEPTSQRVKDAQNALATANANVAREQDNQRRATMNATEALQDQQNKILEGIDARLAFENSVRNLKQAQDDYNGAVKASGPNSDEAKDALGRLQEAQTQQVSAAVRAGEAEAKRRGETDTSRAANDAYARSVGDLVAKSQGELTPALQQMVQGLDAAGLSAAGATVKVDETGRHIAVFPDGKTVVLNADPLGALTGLDRVKAALDLAPDHKTITLDALDGPARQTLTNLGYTIRDVDGKVVITANDDQARNRLIAFQQYAAWQVANPQLAADPKIAYDKMREFLVNAGHQTGVPALDADRTRADQTVREAVDAYNREHPTPQLHVDTAAADRESKSWWDTFKGWIANNPFNFWQPSRDAFAGAPPGGAAGGLVQAATGGHIAIGRARRPLGFPTGGTVRGPGTATSDSIPAMLSNGEFVVRKRSVDAIGVDTLHRINAMSGGGIVGYAAGGRARPDPQAGGTAPAVAATEAAPAADTAGVASSAAAAATSTGQMAGAMTGAATAAGTLAPALAGLIATQTAVTAGQQAMVASGITPLVGAMYGSLFPTLGTYQTAVGVAAPAANTALQTSQLATQTSTTATAANTALNSSMMTGAITGMSLAAQAQHAGLRAGELATQATTTQTAVNTAANSANMAATTTGMSLAAQAQHAGLRAGQGLTRISTDQTAANNATNSAAMSVQTGTMSAVSQNHLANLRGAQGVTRDSTVAFADSWRDQMARTQPDSGRPIKWIIDFPMRSIVDAWNNLDGQFSLGKHVNPAVANFAVGGRVRGRGTGTSDSILANVSNGEFVVRESIASRVPHFLNALNSGQPEAVQAAGGRRANPYPGYAGGGIVAAQQFAISQNGKPYQWGGTGNPSWDCSGFMSGITHALRGENPFSGRLGQTATMPWGGFIPGLRGAFTIGNSKRAGHMAGTLAGVNVESGGSNGVHYGPPAIGADNGLFEEKWTLPQVGGVFVSGGAGGGSFDPTPMVDDAFKKAFGEIADVTKYFGNSPQVLRDQGVAQFSADKVKQKALDQLMTMFASSGLWGPLGAGAPFIVKQICDAARAFGLGIDGATIGVATGLVESNLQNLPGGDRDSVGVFQQRPSQGWGSIQECMNVLHAAGSFFRKFPPNWRSMVPGDVAQSVQRSAFPAKYQQRMGEARGLVAQHGGAFDNGGLLQPGAGTYAFNGTRYPERVLDNVETRSYDTLTRLLGKGGVAVDLPQTESPRSGATWNFPNAVFEQPVDVDTLMQRADFRERAAQL